MATKEKRHVIVHLLTDQDDTEKLTFDIMREHEPRLFDFDYQKGFEISTKHKTTIFTTIYLHFPTKPPINSCLVLETTGEVALAEVKLDGALLGSW